MARYKAGEFSGESARLLHPRFWRSPSLAHLTDGARLLYLGILNQTDSRGIAPGEVRHWRASCWGYQENPPSMSAVEGYLGELENCDSSDANENQSGDVNETLTARGCITRYTVGTTSAILVHGFAKWNGQLKAVAHANIPEPPPALARLAGTQSQLNRKSKRSQTRSNEIKAQSIPSQFGIELPLRRKSPPEEEEEVEDEEDVDVEEKEKALDVPPTEEEEGDPFADDQRTHRPDLSSTSTANGNGDELGPPLSEEELLSARQEIAKSLEQQKGQRQRDGPPE